MTSIERGMKPMHVRSRTMKIGDMIEAIHPHDSEEQWVKIKVYDLLSAQFTVIDCDNKVQFYFYRDKGVTWRQT
jgi:hypothetical protein